MKEGEYNNVTVQEHYSVYPIQNTTDAGHIDELLTNAADCEQLNSYPAMFEYYINNSQVFYPADPTMWKKMNYVLAIKISVLIIMIIGGLLGNISVIFTVALNSSIRNTVNFYIANLAFADAMTCIFGLLLQIFHTAAGEYYVLGAFLCKFENFAVFTCVISSVLTLIAISFDRFMAVVFPLHARVTEYRRSVVAMIIWIISMAVPIPFLIVTKLQVTEWKNFLQAECKDDWPYHFYYSKSLGKCVFQSTFLIVECLVITVCLYFLPVLIMILAYSFILWKLWVVKAPGEYHEENDVIQTRAKKKVIKMVIVILLAFIICWTPFHVGLFYVIFYFHNVEIHVEWWKDFKWYVGFFGFGNSVINPIIYAGFSRDLREGIRAIFHCRKPVINLNPPRNTPNRLCAARKTRPENANMEIEL